MGFEKGSAAIILALALVAASVGCTHPQLSSGKPAQVDAEIEPGDLTAPVHLSGCDARTSPLRCRRVVISYRKGRERLEVTTATAK